MSNSPNTPDYTDSDEDHIPLYGFGFDTDDTDDTDDMDNTDDKDEEHQSIISTQESSSFAQDINTDIIPSLPPIINYDNYQENVNQSYKHFTTNIEKVFKCLPLIFLENHEQYKIYEYGKKIIAPQSLLHELSSYQDLPFPVFVKLGINDTLFGVAEYLPYIDHIYIPTNLFYQFNLAENSDLMVTILKDPPPIATKIGIMPLDENFYSIEDIKSYLEIMFKKTMISLTLEEIIELPYLDTTIKFQIKSLEPAPIISIHDIEQVEIDLLPNTELQSRHIENIVPVPIQENTASTSLRFNQSSTDRNDNKSELKQQTSTSTSNDSAPFTPFSGEGRTLGSS